MGKNIIYYGPPGTGKTFLVQNICEDYTDYAVTDDQIRNAYISTSSEWLAIALIILQNNNNLTSSGDIAKRIEELTLKGFNATPSTILEEHSIILNPGIGLLGNIANQPKIFKFDFEGWNVDVNRLREYDEEIFNLYVSNKVLDKRFDFVTFHQSFVYEDFVEGIRPVTTEDIGANQTESIVLNSNATLEEKKSNISDIKYSIQPGVFKRLCKIADANRHKNYAIIIDEINRGNISEIFGELITLIEPDKRAGELNQLTVTLPYSKEPFSVPRNIDIYATMNSADRSIALIDFALRRRFNFEKIPYSPEILKNALTLNGINPINIEGLDLIRMLDTINNRIELLLDSNYLIGHAFFMKVKSFNEVKQVIINKVIPLLEEYFYTDLQKIQMIFNDLDLDGNCKDNAIYKHKILESANLFEFQGDYNLEDKRTYFINPHFDMSSVIKIYQSV